MGRSLYEGSAAARAIYDEANHLLGWDLKKVSFEGPEAELTETKACQPALFVHGMAMLAALDQAGRLPAAQFALGLSLGEVTALAAAGACDFATGLRVVARRARLMQEACEQTSGAMAAVISDRPAVEALCAEFDVEAANFNAPGQIIISGEKHRIEAAVAAAKERGIKKAILLNVAGAYHSRLMESARTQFAAFLETVTFQAPRLTVFTNTTAAPVSDPESIRTALARQVVSPVLWEDCMRAAAGAGARTFWEIGPGTVLAGLARRTDKSWQVSSFAEFADVAPVAA